MSAQRVDPPYPGVSLSVITWFSLLQASEPPTYSLQHFRERSLESWTGLCNPVIFLGLLEMRNCSTI